MIDTLAVKEPSIENTTTPVLGGSTSSDRSVNVWSPLSKATVEHSDNRKLRKEQ